MSKIFFQVRRTRQMNLSLFTLAGVATGLIPVQSSLQINSRWLPSVFHLEALDFEESQKRSLLKPSCTVDVNPLEDRSLPVRTLQLSVRPSGKDRLAKERF